MFKRDILEQLSAWANKSHRKPLILRGARQVGKTTVVHQFGEGFENYLYVNLEDELARGLFASSRSVAEVLTDLFIYCGRERRPGKTLLFLDEVQNSERAVAALRYFYEQLPEIYVIAAGSLLENLIDVHASFPVGRVEYMALHPCSFREFLVAMGEESLRRYIESSPEASVPFHAKLLSLYNRYALIGGMPEAIQRYAESKDLKSLDDVYETLLQGYRDDVEKYARNRTQTDVIRYILTYGWGEAGKQITLGRFASSDYKARETGEAFRTLEKALLLELVYPTTSVSLPILPDVKRAPKLIWLDTGLVNYAAGIQKEVFAAKDILDVWRGAIAEQLVAQELLTLTDKVSARRSFWVRGKEGASAEVDFVWSYDGVMIPIEVKSGHNAHLRSLHSFVNQSEHCNLAVRVWGEPLSCDRVQTTSGQEFTLLNVPYYMVGMLGALVYRAEGKFPSDVMC